MSVAASNEPDVIRPKDSGGTFKRTGAAAVPGVAPRRARLRMWLAATFDLRDGFFFGGLLVAGAGGALLSVPWTLVAIGAVLTIKGHGPLIVRRNTPPRSDT